jgi:hypothetical protein
MITLLYEQSEASCPAGRPDGNDLWITANDLEQAIGWSMKSEGLCRGDICVPVPAGRIQEFVRGDTVNIAAFWRRMGNPVVRDEAGEVWVLGTSAADRSNALRSLEAPDFSLPDLSGKSQRLSDQRGRKVLLVTWASW